jgi:hypothetical protein
MTSRMLEYQDEMVLKTYSPARLKAGYKERVRRVKLNIGVEQQLNMFDWCR